MSIGGLSSISSEGLYWSSSWIKPVPRRAPSEQVVLWPGLTPAGLLNGPCTTLYCLFLCVFPHALVQKATSISTCWNVPCSSKPPGQETSLMWYHFPANLPRTLCPCAPSRVIVDDSPGYGRHPPTRPGTTSLKDDVYFTSKSPWWSLIKASWRPISWISHLPRINSFYITIQSLYISNPYLQKHFHFETPWF